MSEIAEISNDKPVEERIDKHEEAVEAAHDLNEEDDEIGGYDDQDVYALSLTLRSNANNHNQYEAIPYPSRRRGGNAPAHRPVRPSMLAILLVAQLPSELSSLDAALVLSVSIYIIFSLNTCSPRYSRCFKHLPWSQDRFHFRSSALRGT